MKKLLVLIILMALPTALRAEDTVIEVKNYMFVPQSITVKAGTVVTWKNTDQIPHGIADKNKLFRSPAIDTGETYSFTYTTPGTYSYFCTLHPYMTGTIIVVH